MVVSKLSFLSDLLSAMSDLVLMSFWCRIDFFFSSSGMLVVLGVSEPFKGVWGVTEESDVESLFELAK